MSCVGWWWYVPRTCFFFFFWLLRLDNNLLTLLAWMLIDAVDLLTTNCSRVHKYIVICMYVNVIFQISDWHVAQVLLHAYNLKENATAFICVVVVVLLVFFVSFLSNKSPDTGHYKSLYGKTATHRKRRNAVQISFSCSLSGFLILGTANKSSVVEPGKHKIITQSCLKLITCSKIKHNSN